MVYEALSNLRVPFNVKGFSTRLSKHEGIKAQLYILGFKLHLIPVLECAINGDPDGRCQRIDCIYFKDFQPVCAIEVDYSIKKKSLSKLAALPENVEKIILSYGKSAATSKALYRHHEKLGSIKNYLLHSN